MAEKRAARVLTVDDTPATRYALARVLRHAGFDVAEADTGSAALRMAPENDVVCLDVQLPDMSGFEVCARLKANAETAAIPIIHVTSSFADDLSKARGLEGGADAYLTLPVEPHVLIATIRSLLRLRQTERELKVMLEREQSARQEAESARETLEFLARATTSLVASLDHQETISRTVGVCVPHLADGGVVWLSQGGSLVRAATAGTAVEGALPPALSGVAGGPARAVALGRPIRLDRLAPGSLGPGLESYEETLRGLGVVSLLWAPLTVSGRAFGVLALFRTGARAPFDETDALIAQQIAMRAAAAIEKARLYSELRRTDRAKEEFLSMLAHELRNPLEPIITAAHLLGRGEVEPAIAERARRIIQRQTRHMARLVDDLLDVSRINTGRIELRTAPIDLNTVVAETAEDYRGQMEAQVLALVLDLAPEPVPLRADAARIRQVLGNLLHNATKFTPRGGTIRVTTRVDADGATASLVVRDTGIGISEETMTRLFTPFVQGEKTYDRSHGGLGLGLAVARGLVTLHGGTIEATSAGRGEGAEVRVTLPLDPAGAAASALPAPAAVVTPLRILIAEDSWDAASALRDFLELGGHTVAVEPNGRSAVDTARVFRPDVVLCDLGLPELDGFEVARALRADPALAGVRLVALSGYAQVEDRKRSAEAGFDCHIAKPVDPKELEAILAG